VELGVRAEVSVDARCAGARQRAITEHILALAGRAGHGAALIDAAGAAVTTWPQFAATIRAAAGGLSRRGLREDDTAGVLTEDAVSHAVAIHSIRAAGAVAAPVQAAAADVAGQLKQCRARLLITSAALAELAIDAAERSLVRQVVTFGEAEGATPFSDLVETAKHGRPGIPRVADLRDLPDFDLNGLVLDAYALRLTSRDVVVAAPPCGRDDSYTSLLDLALAAGATVVAAPLTQITAAVAAYRGTAAIVPAGTDVPALPADRILTVG